MDTPKLSWGTLILLLLPFIGVLIVLLQRWLESKEEPITLEAHGHGEHEEMGHEAPETDAAEAEMAQEGAAAVPAVSGQEPANAPEAIAAEAKPAPEAIAAEAKPAPEAIAAEAKPAPEAIAAEAKPAPEALVAEAKPAAEAPTGQTELTEDDLEIIEGIGPKIAQVLREAGITTFTRLAQTSPETLRDIMKNARIRLAAPESWPEQARLAAEGKWEELRAYQDRLKGGR